MQITIQQAENKIRESISALGFDEQETAAITENFLEAELVGKKTHGLLRISWIREKVTSGSMKISHEDIFVVKESPVSLFIDAKKRSGYYAVNEAVKMGIQKAKQTGICAVGTTNASPSSGYIGLFARKATEQNLIFLCFSDGKAGLIPYGSTKDFWGTNPITIGVPTQDLPVILDMAATQITFGELMLRALEGKVLEEGIALDEHGQPTTDAKAALKGGILPIAKQKGSGLAFIVRIFSALLTTYEGSDPKDNWGNFFIVIDPNLFRNVEEFKKAISEEIVRLKNLPKMAGFQEIYFPGEQSLKRRVKNTTAGTIDISDKVYKELFEKI